MSDNNIRIEDEVIRDGLVHAIGAFESDSGRQIAVATASLVESGVPEAYFVPTVRFVLDSALHIITNPLVEPQLSREVIYRQDMASSLANKIAHVAVRGSLIKALYARDPALSETRAPYSDVERIDRADYVGSLGATPFFDVRIIGGGAYKLLEAKSIKNPIEVIQRSHGLLAIAGVFKDPEIVRLVYRMLGLPYASEDSFELVENDGEIEVDFIRDIKQMLKVLHVKGRGCPAAKTPSPTTPNRQLIHDYWSSIVEALIPPDATLDAIS